MNKNAKIVNMLMLSIIFCTANNNYCGKNTITPFTKQEIMQEPQNRDECAICYEEIKKSQKNSVTLKCNSKHIFHRQCVQDWLKKSKTCPFCRQPTSIVEKDFIEYIRIILPCLKIK